jgi:hypothetical protein
MNSVKLLIEALVSTLSGLLGKTSGPVLALVFLTAFVVPGSLLFRYLWRHWSTWSIEYRQRAVDAVFWRPGYRGTSSRRTLIQSTQDSVNHSESVYEYSLYALVVLLTIVAVIFYRAAAHDDQISSLTIYAGAVYFAGLALAFNRLNAIYRRRKQRNAGDLPGVDPGYLSVHTELVRDTGEPDGERSRELADFRMGTGSRPFMGLSKPQLAILLLIFLTACLTFTWALSVLR